MIDRFQSIGLGAVLCAVLVACSPAMQDQVPGAVLVAPGEGPPDARPGACYGKDVTPAVVEQVTEREIVEPAKFASDGSLVKPAVYRLVSHQKIVEDRREFYFEVPCPDRMTPDFIASLQRALKARGLYRGPVTGQMDDRTRKAVRTFQMPTGLNTDILTLDSALKLGLIAYGRDDSGG